MPSPEKFLVEAKEVAPIGDELVPKLEGNIDLALRRFYSRKTLVAKKIYQSQFLASHVLWPPIMTRTQRIYFILIAPQQLGVFNYSQNKAIKTNHEQNSFLYGLVFPVSILGIQYEVKQRLVVSVR